MATATLTAAMKGAYELALPAGTIITIEIEPTNPGGVIFANLGTNSIYYQLGITVTAKDGNASTIPPGLFRDGHIPPGDNSTYAFTSTADTTVSVIRK